MPKDNNQKNNDQNNQNNDQNNQNNNQNNQNNNQQQNNNLGGGKKYAVGMDSNQSNDSKMLDRFCKALTDCGNTVKHTQIGPNQELYLADLAKSMNADACIFLCLIAPDTVWSFTNAVESGTLPHTIFAVEGWIDGHEVNGMDEVRNFDFFKEHDSDQFMDGAKDAQQHKDAEKVNAKTLGEWADAKSQYVTLCTAKDPETMAQNICSGSCGSGGGGGGTAAATTSGGGAQIKDKTFEDCIRRICAATDSIFLVENNAAVLFPYTDWMAFTLRHKIQQIRAKDIDPDLFEIDYNTDGFYNKVTVVWGADEEDQEKTTKDKQKEEDKEKKGNVTTIQKTMPTGGTQISEQYDPLVEIYGELEKKVTTNFPNEETAHFVMNALLIQYIRDFNNSCRARVINNQKFIGGTFYAVENPNSKKSELFYLNSYTMFKDKKQPLVSDMEFKYGPEGAEELLDYQVYGGGGGAGNNAPTANATGSATEEEIWKGTQKACHQESCPELRVGESDTTDPKVAEDYYNKMVKAGKKFCLTCYGMSSWLYYQFNNKAGIPCRVIGNDEHHVVELYKNNSWYKPTDEYSKYCAHGYRYNDFCRGNAPVLLDAPNPPSGSSTNANPSGNTANQNKNKGKGTNNA